MYILEGNIGVGKTTFLKLINKNIPEINILTEPKDNWTEQIYGQSLLENFYKDRKRWSYTLETLAMICRSRDHLREQENKNPNTIMERSIYSGHYCFAQNGFEQGCFSDVEWAIYNKWVDFLLYKKCNTPHGFIYLKADPEICLQRVKKRNRISEKELSLAYIKKIDSLHEKFLIEKTDVHQRLKNVPVLTLDCNPDFIDNMQNLEKHMAKLIDFMGKTTNLILNSQSNFQKNQNLISEQDTL